MSSRRTPQPHADGRVNSQGSPLEGGIPMRTRIITLAAVAALSMGAVACTEAETEQAEADAAVAADQAGDVAAQAGEVIEAGAMKAARAVEDGAGAAADKLEENQAEAAAEGRPGAVNPATDQRVPAN
jgi:hypothetical protein